MAPRRNALKIAFAALSSLIAGALGVPVIAVFFGPLRKPTVRGGNGPTDVGPASALPVGEPKLFPIVRARMDAWDRSDPTPIGAVWLIRRDAEKIDAFSAICPHLGCQVGFDAPTGAFICPCHVSAFALADGRRLAGPSPRGLDPLPVETKDGHVVVSWARFLVGVSSRRLG